MTDYHSLQNKDLTTFPIMGSSDFFNSSRTNTTDNRTHSAGDTSVHDKGYNVAIRITSLYITIIFGIIGGVLVVFWMWYNRKRKARSRINSLILNLTMADLLVIFFGCVPQLVWEYYGRQWDAGDLMCRVIKFMQSFSIMSSTNMLVVIAVDRHQAIRSPLKKAFPVWLMTGIGWLGAGLCSLPMVFVFHTAYSVKHHEVRCENTFRDKALSHRQAWITYVTCIVFFVPLVALIVCYGRIFTKIAQKASESAVGKRQTLKPGKVHLQATPSSSLPKAKIKTLKMTLVIVASFILFGFPYFVCELIMSYGDHKVISKDVYGILGGIAAANSALNPFIFLLFNANAQCLRTFTGSSSSKNPPINKRTLYFSASVKSDYSTDCTRTTHWTRLPPNPQTEMTATEDLTSMEFNMTPVHTQKDS